MIIIIILAVAVAISIGFFIWKAKKNKSAKNCSCGHEYGVKDVASYRLEEKVTMLGGTQTSSVYVTLECPHCKKSEEKRIVVKYSPYLNQNIENGIRDFFS